MPASADEAMVHSLACCYGVDGIMIRKYFLSVTAAFVSLTLYLFSLLLPCFSPEDDPGWALLLFGPLGLVCGEFAWLANPCYLVGVGTLAVSFKPTVPDDQLRKLVNTSLIASIAGFCFSMLFAFQESTYYGNHPVGVRSMISELRLGYWLWVLSMVTLAVASVVRRFCIRSNRGTENHLEWPAPHEAVADASSPVDPPNSVRSS